MIFWGFIVGVTYRQKIVSVPKVVKNLKNMLRGFFYLKKEAHMSSFT
jgi:hypothetical protein